MDTPETYPGDLLVGLATRAAIRAQPTFRFLAETPQSDARELLEALHVCAWSGAVAFAPTAPDAKSLSTAVNRALEIAKGLHPDRPEILAADWAYSLTKAGAKTVKFRGHPIDAITQAASHAGDSEFSRYAIEAVQSDLSRLKETPEVVSSLTGLPLWLGRTPPSWLPIINEWTTLLRRYELSELAASQARVPAQATSGSFDWNEALAFIVAWGARHAPQSAGATKRTRADSATSADSTPVAVDLGQYAFSFGAQTILTSAIEGLKDRQRRALSTTAVLLQMAEEGRPVTDPQWIGDFVHQALAAHPGPYSAARETYGFLSERSTPSRTKKAAAEPLGSVPMLPGLAWALTRAQSLAKETGDGKIYGRHLFAALVIDPPPPHSLGSQRRLSEIGINVPLLRQRLYEWVRGYGENDETWRVALMGGGITPRRRAEFDADGTTGPDLLNIDQDVVALATLIAARDSAPPLSIGLFGDWGSGKTFFMGRLRRTVAQLSDEARGSRAMQRDLPFYKRIVQIEFNAWHYAEGNLWASMVEHILANLRISDEQDPTVTEQLQKHFIDKLGFAQKASEEADQKKGEAAAKVTSAESAVRVAENAHEAKKRELQELSRKTAARDFQLSGALPVVVEALKPLGITPLSDAVMDLQSSIRQARAIVARGHAGLTALVHAPDRKDRWRSLLTILIGAPVAAAALALLMNWLTASDQIGRIFGMASGAAGLLTGGAQWLRKQAGWLSQQQQTIEQAQQKYDEALAKALASVAQDTARTEQELALARQDYMLAHQRAEQARREQEVALTDLMAATTSRLLGRFIQDRAASTDYRKHLGVLAIVRQDFQQLSRLIEEDNWRLAPENSEEDKRFSGRLSKIASLDEEEADADRRINRIVLYIDDLDRCQPVKVVEVLQAVHLLLAFPLFVVVVGVDARWISRSLESRYRELLHVGDAEGAVDIAEMFGVARSEDYLEKIFQIPLWLRRMDANAARRMVQGLLRSGRVVPSAKETQDQPVAPKAATDAPSGGLLVTPATNAAPLPAGDESTSPVNAPGAPQASGSGAPPPNASGAVTAARPLRPAIVPNLESLNIHDFEVEVIDALSPLIGRSPRSLKRFVNLYRLIKAGLTPTEHDVFIHRSEKNLDDYAAVLFLLAVDTGLPRAGVALFDVLFLVNRNPTHEIEIKDFLQELEKHPEASSPESATLKAWIDAHRRTRWFGAGAIRRLAAWAPRVARHSFQATRTGSPGHLVARKRPAKRAATAG